MKQLVDNNNLSGILGEFPSNRIKVNPKQFNEYTFFIDEPIGEPSNYRDEFNTLITASDMDIVNIIINSPGGSIDSTNQLIQAIQSSAAEITAVLVGETHSAASMLALNCPNVFVTPVATMLVHTGFYNSINTAPNVKRHVDFTHDQINKLLDETYEGFMSLNEISEVKEGKEFWFDADEIKTRLEKRHAYFEKKQKDAEKAEKAVKPTTKQKAKPQVLLEGE